VDVKEAVKRAKSHLDDLFIEDRPLRIRLEEVERDEETGDWRITLSLGRAGARGVQPLIPDFKLVIMRDNGEVRAVRHRVFASG
jgi:hypothetical protein